MRHRVTNGLDALVVDEAEANTIRVSAEAEIADGIEFARNGTDPIPTEVTRDVYTA